MNPQPARAEPVEGPASPLKREAVELPEEGDAQEQAARDWLAHVEAGRIGQPSRE